MKKYLQVGERLRELREKLRISQEEFAKRLQISPRGYQKYEAGERVPHPHKLTKIAEMCDTTVDWILTGELNIDKARMMERLKRAHTMEELVEQLEESARREERLLYKGAKEEGPEYGLEELKEKDFIEKLRSYIASVKIDLMPAQTRALIENVIEILGSGSTDIVDALKGNVKAFLGATRAAKEKRHYPRVSLTVPVEFQIMDQKESRSGAVINGSQMGCLIQASQDMPVGTKIHLKLTLPGMRAEDSFRASAEIMWKDKQRADDTETYHYGVRFLEVLNEGHAKLDALINQSRAKRKEKEDGTGLG